MGTTTLTNNKNSTKNTSRQVDALQVSPKHKQGIIRRLAIRSNVLKRSKAYLDYMHYYFQEHSVTKTIADGQDIIWRMAHCQHTWLKESKGDAVRFRGVGCGERDYDMLCGSYTQVMYSREIARQLLDAQTACEIAGAKLESYGQAMVFPLDKRVSARIDDLLFNSESDKWSREVNALFNMVNKLLKHYFGANIGSILSLDFTGESCPYEAHYHINAYVFPCELVRDKHSISFIPLKWWLTSDDLKQIRGLWRDAQNDAYKLDLTEANFNYSFVSSEAKIFHWLRYLYRHSLYDLWRGWQGYDTKANVLTYTYKKRGQIITLNIDGGILAKAFQRLDLIPKHFKRIRRYGVLSDGQIGKTMALLGLERQELDDTDESDKWSRDGSPLKLVRFESDGVVLEVTDINSDKLGWHVKVLDELIDYAPSEVKLGRRIVWRRPDYKCG